MKIYFLIEIALLLAACITAVIMTVKNVKLRKKVADQDESISNLIEGIYADTRMLTKWAGENQRLKAEHKNLLNGIVEITAPLPKREEKETDAHYNQRCRQMVANMCARKENVNISDKLISITILR